MRDLWKETGRDFSRRRDAIGLRQNAVAQALGGWWAESNRLSNYEHGMLWAPIPMLEKLDYYLSEHEAADARARLLLRDG